eukprot:Nk52_evm5s24 gene=Nk52_evmTU5s24
MDTRSALIFTAGAGAAAAAYYLYKCFKESNQCDKDFDKNKYTEVIQKLEDEFSYPLEEMKTTMATFHVEMDKGLKKSGQEMKMIPTFIEHLPMGTERGHFLALDLGGSNFRVLKLHLDGMGEFHSDAQKYVIPQSAMTGRGEELFDFIANCVADFVPETVNGKDNFPLGFTFSFPVDQTALNSGKLIQWTKGFSSSNVVGKDVVELLQKAFDKKNIKCNVVAMINDTVGTMLARTIDNRDCFVGLILGTGSNACYLEDSSKIAKWDGKRKTNHMVINMEWGNFDQSRKVLPFTKYDNELDAKSINTGFQLYEKMISGMYLGEITRLVCLNLIAQGDLFGGRTSTKMNTQWAFQTAFMSAIENDISSTLYQIKQLVSREFGISNITMTDRKLLKKVCELVSTRAARLSAAGIAAIVSKINKVDGCTVAVDGSVFQHYPNFEARMYTALTEIFGFKGHNIHFVRAEDGSGKGAALAATVAI